MTLIHVIDDAQEVRESLEILLEACGYAVMTYGSALEFLDRFEPGPLACIITDVLMPGMSGLELQEELKRRKITIPLIVITGHADIPTAVAAIKAGAVDFLEKPFRDDALLSCIENALSYLRPQDGPQLQSLTPREYEVFLLLTQGHSNKAIANRLDISPRTVEVHRAHIMEKLGAKNLAELIHLSILTNSK